MARPARRLGNLPAEATSFIGRRGELAELRGKLRTARLVSLVGPGGVGKTRLAVRIGTDLERGFRDGAWLVELADIRDAGLVSNAVMLALDLRDQAATKPLPLLLAYVRDKQLLLVVDNCEHLLDAAGKVIGEIMKAAPGLRVIATSREPLSVEGEHIVPIPPLALPSGQQAEPLGQLRQNEAVMLFTERAAAAWTTLSRFAPPRNCQRPSHWRCCRHSSISPSSAKKTSVLSPVIGCTRPCASLPASNCGRPARKSNSKTGPPSITGRGAGN